MKVRHTADEVIKFIENRVVGLETAVYSGMSQGHEEWYEGAIKELNHVLEVFAEPICGDCLYPLNTCNCRDKE